MEPLLFSMKGAPRAKGRPRFRIVKAGRKQFVQTYTDPATRKYEASVKAVVAELMAGASPLHGPLSVSLRFRMPIPKSETKATRAGMAAGEVAHISKPDSDNLAKAILDAMNGVAFGSDSQITRLFVTKVYADKPGVDVRVEAFAPQTAGAAA